MGVNANAFSVPFKVTKTSTFRYVDNWFEFYVFNVMETVNDISLINSTYNEANFDTER